MGFGERAGVSAGLMTCDDSRGDMRPGSRGVSEMCSNIPWERARSVWRLNTNLGK